MRIKIWKKAVLIVFLLLTVISTKERSKAAVNNEQTDTKKVAIDDTVAIADASKYKDMDYSFLKTMEYAKSLNTDTVFTDVNQMKIASLKEGQKVKTKGYYSSGDQGAACYEVSKTFEKGGVKLDNGLFANIMPDSYVDKNGTKWLIANVRQFGGKGDAVHEDHEAINFAVARVGKLINETKDTGASRGIIYLPEGEYKLGYGIEVGYSNLNFVGEGDKSVIVTDNDYRDEEGYSEFLFTCWGCKNMYFGNFRIEAREVDLYHYMRQFVVVYSQNVYVYKVNLIIPQSTYNSYYFEDKQYSNFCCYSGNKDVTVDDCIMEQMSGTYRGANLGILDIWASGEENITVMNCDFYGNARDEQIGFFSKNDPNASVKHVDFINNTMHSAQLRYVDIIGNRTMCFTVAYADSQNIDDIRIAGNHFICESDSKFMTLGEMKNCKFEDNILEIKCTYQSWSMLFDSANSSPDNILVRNNDIFITSDFGIGRGNITGGNLTLSNNRILFDTQLVFGVYGPEIHNNKIIGLAQCGTIGMDSNVTGNEIHLYNELGSVGTNKKQFAIYMGSSSKKYVFSNNKCYDYMRCLKWEGLRGVFKIEGSFDSLKIDKNEFYFPNSRFVTSDIDTPEIFKDEIGKYYKNKVFRYRYGTVKSIDVTNNIFQNTIIPESDNVFHYTNNQELPPEEDINEEVCVDVKIMYKGKEVSCISTTEASVDLDDVEYVASEKDANGKIISKKVITGKQVQWYTSSERMASVSSDGKVERKLYGEVQVYAVPLDGTDVHGKCMVIFEKEQSSGVQLASSSIELQPKLKYYTEYRVLPQNASQRLVWSSSNETVAKVDVNGTVTAVAEGEAIITGKTLDGSGKTCEMRVKVNPLTVKQIIMDAEYWHMNFTDIGTTKQLNVKEYVPSAATNQGIGKWESTNPDIASVDQNGLVTFNSEGKCIIKAYSKDGKCYGKTYVYIQPGKVENLVGKGTSTEARLSWNARPNVTGYLVYQWDASKSEWVAINEGNGIKDNQYIVQGLEKGKTYKFCVRSYVERWEVGSNRTNYVSDEQTVTVTTLTYNPVEVLMGSTSKLGILEGKTAQLAIYCRPLNANYDKLNIEVKIDDPSFLKLESVAPGGSQSKLYTFKALKKGATTVTFTSNDAWKASITIGVRTITDKIVDEKTTEVTAVSKGNQISFNGLENEKQLVSDGLMNGYMIRRTQTNEFSDHQFIPANGSTRYTYLDDNVEAGATYSYTVVPCYSENDKYYLGTKNGKFTVTTKDKILSNKINIKQQLYIVGVGKSVTILAGIEPGDVSTTKLNWSVLDKTKADIATVGAENLQNLSYAVVSGKAIGVCDVLAETTDGSNLNAKTKLLVTPGKVVGVQTSKVDKAIAVTWNKIEGVSGYYVYRYDSAKNSWNTIADVNDSKYVDSNVKIDENYQYMVSAYLEYEGKKYEGVLGNTIEATGEVINDKDSEKNKEKNEETKSSENKDVMDETSGIIPSGIVFNDNSNTRVFGYVGTYDGKSHEVVTMTNLLDNDVVMYSMDKINWNNTSPKITNVWESKIIYVKITRNGLDYLFSVIARVEPVNITSMNISLSKKSFEWNGKQHHPKIETALKSGEYTVSYSGKGDKVGTYTVNVKGIGNYIGDKTLKYAVYIVKGNTYKVKNLKYKVLKNGNVEVVGCTNKSQKQVTIGNTVKIGGIQYTISSIGSKAFSNLGKLEKITIGKNVKKVGSKAFYCDKQLKQIVFKSNNLKSIGNKALLKINNKAVITVPKKSKKQYKKLLTKKTGYKKTMKIK